MLHDGGLTMREAQVGELLARGFSEKQIAGELAVSASAVSRAAQTTAGKLGVRSRVEVAARFAALRRAPGHPSAELGALSPAERVVVGLVTRGHSDAEVALARGSSPRTVQNQLQQIYRKLGVHSRTELAARFFG